MRSTPLLLGCACLALVSLRPLRGDTLTLSNGSKLVGTVTKEEGGKIYFHAELIGDVVLDATAVVERSASSAAVAAAPASSATPPAPAAAPAATETATPVPAAVTKAPAAPSGVASTPGAASEAAAASGAKAFWKRILSVNGSYTSASYQQGPIKGAPAGFPTGAQAGLQGAQSSLQISGTLIGATPYQSFTLTGSYGYANYQPVGAVLNNKSVEGTYVYVLSPKDYLLEKTTYKTDKPSGIEHAFEQVVGFGHKFIDTPQTKLDVIPGLSMVDDDRGTVWDNKWILSGGFLEHLDYAFNERVSLEERFKYRVGLAHTQVWAIDSYLGIKAAITEHLSFTTGLTFTFDNTLGPVPPAVRAGLLAQGVPVSLVDQLEPAKKDQILLTSGLEYNW